MIVVGAGASAMDNAATALEAGCARMDLLVRRAAIPVIDKFTGTGSRGMTAGYVGLPDEAKWDLMDEGDRFPVPPPKHSVERVARHAHAHLHLGAAVEKVEETAGGIRVTTPKGVIEADVAIFATGFGVALDERPNFRPLLRTSAHGAMWSAQTGWRRTRFLPRIRTLETISASRRKSPVPARRWRG